jgi:protein-S-isoprenylcysteine O-methyltransferase Ste14
MTEQDTRTAEKTRGAGRFVVRLIAMWILLPLFFLATGGTLRWWQAWAWCALLLVPMSVFGLWMAWKDPEFLARRFQLREKERAQRRILAWGWPLFIALAVLPGLDRRFGWSDVPLSATVAALALSLAGYLAILRVFIENRWAGRTIETVGGQQVISTGPYAVVRHPMYTGTLVLWLATPLALGSWWALLPALAIIPVFVFRIRNEEEVLVRELPGYEEYRGKVRYRLLPRVW